MKFKLLSITVSLGAEKITLRANSPEIYFGENHFIKIYDDYLRVDSSNYQVVNFSVENNVLRVPLFHEKRAIEFIRNTPDHYNLGDYHIENGDINKDPTLKKIKNTIVKEIYKAISAQLDNYYKNPTPLAVIDVSKDICLNMQNNEWKTWLPSFIKKIELERIWRKNEREPKQKDKSPGPCKTGGSINILSSFFKNRTEKIKSID